MTAAVRPAPLSVTASATGPVVWCALGVFLVVRLAAIGAFDVAQSSDMAWYHGRALELLAGHGYSERGVPTAFWPVGYPAFLAGVMALARPSALVGQLANVALGALALLLLHRFCIQRFGDRRVAALAVVLLAVYPNHIGYAVGLYSEPLFTALLLGLTVLVAPGAGWGRMALAGLLAGLAALVKAQMLLLAPLLLFVLCLAAPSRAAAAAALRRTACAMAVMALTIAPWTLRNLAVMGAPVPVSTNGGMSLLAGNNPSVTLGLDRDFDDQDPLFQVVAFSVADQVAADRRAKAAAFGWIAANPGRFIALMPKKLFRLWVPDGESEWLFQAGYGGYDAARVGFRSVRIVNQLFYLALLAGGAVGLWRCVRRDVPASWTVPTLIVFFSALSMVFSGQSRYHAPLMPFVIAYAAWAGVHLRRIREASR